MSARSSRRDLLVAAVSLAAASSTACGKKAASKVKKAMHERKSGTLKSGRSGKKVTSKKQAIAIGLSEARREGGKVPRKKTAASKKKTGASKKKTPASKKRSTFGRVVGFDM